MMMMIINGITLVEKWVKPEQLAILTSGKLLTPIPTECEALAGDFSGFRLSLLPLYVGFWTVVDASISQQGTISRAYTRISL